MTVDHLCKVKDLGSNLCLGQANKSEFKLHPDMPKGCCMWIVDHLGSWTEAKELSLQGVPPLRQASVGGLMVLVLCFTPFSSIEHPRYFSGVHVTAQELLPLLRSMCVPARGKRASCCRKHRLLGDL